jgi:pantoate--beta-alanine ligase
VEVLKTKAEVKSLRSVFYKSNKTLGFVPTMGALHNGHVSLIEKAKLSSDCVGVSIFVNPTQFNNSIDFEKYPKTLEEDLKKLQNAGVDFVFIPEVDEIYSLKSNISLDFGHLDKTLEGAFRPGHFNGVGTVVAKLLNIVKPDLAFFGQKDLQQLSIIKCLVNDLSFDVKIIEVPTLREKDGLAMSSRNLRLLPEEREQATVLFRALEYAKNELLAGENWLKVKENAVRLIENQPLARLEYFELIHPTSFTTLDALENLEPAAICTAAYLGEIRLIDNIYVKTGESL